MSSDIFRRLSIAVFLLALFVLPLAHTRPAGAQTSTISLEQELVERYAPVVMIKKQTVECSADGEQFRPVAVDILFGTDDVRLLRNEGGRAVEVKRNIQASDLSGLDDSYYLDLPFDPRNPGCNYEKWGKQRMAELGLEPSLYARIVTEEGQPGIVIQYWYYWVYNLFNDVHESDWEGIQLNFDAGSVKEILDNHLLPSEIAFAQHAGGEQATWDASKVETQETHIVSHPSSGSHADYYGSAVWLGWGENGSGFGCDRSEAPEEELPVEIILMPNEVTGPNDPFAWLTFEGNWGELEVPGLFSGPKGPNEHPRWDHPISWSQDVRKNSLPVPEHPTIGPGISEVFCGAAEFGSKLVILFGVDSRDITFLIIGFGIFLLAFSLLVWRYTVDAVWLYFRHGYYFITIGVLAVPVAILTQSLENRLQDELVTHVTSRLPDSQFWRVTYEFLLRSMVGGVQAVLMAAIIGPFAIYGAYHVARLRRSDASEMWLQGAHFLPRVFGSRVLVGLLVRAITLTIVLTPLAVYKWAQWFFGPQAVVVDRTTVVESIHVSTRRISRGHWLRAAAMVVAFHALVGLPAPLIGTAALILAGVKLEHAQLISGVLYCVLFPMATIAATLFYLDRTIAPGTFAPYVAPAAGSGVLRPEP
ncbi:MAG TPA: hypothetical protein VFP05_19510 [Thermomicrobiales bacterium]|nr:hypothetical protein [Thermomicrobiales bacterium]